MPGIEIEEVQNPLKHREFVELAWQVNAHDPDWVPPLRMDLAKLLNRKKYPFFKYGDVAYFVARRSGRPIGRIAAIENRLHGERYKDGRGFFGLFECEDDVPGARALFKAAAQWLAGRKLQSVLGPFNYSINDMAPGVLAEGFNGPPLILMAHNPRYYARLLGDVGLAKAKDLYAYLVTEEVLKSERFSRVMNALRRRAPEIEQREIHVSGAAFTKDVQLVLDMFNAAWEDNWGFVKVMPEEVAAIAADLRQIVRPELTSIASVKGQPVAFAVCVPNVNEVLRKIPDGRLTTAFWKLGPAGFLDLAMGRSEIKGFRTMLMGVLPEYRNKGIDALMISKIIESGFALNQRYCELSWVLEDNVAMNSLSEKVGGLRYRTYRLFEAPLAKFL